MADTKVIRLLGAARLSIETDESTSIDRQKTGLNGWSSLRSQITGDDYRVIDITEDSDVSGAVSPFKRAGLGPYLRKPLLDTWDTLIVYRLDRLTRSIADFEELWKFLDANDKTLVSVAEEINFGTPAGRLIARQLVLFAEFEREQIKARVKNAYDAGQAQGKYMGMQFPFGYIPAKLPGKGWGLEPHPVYGPIVEDLADRLIAGETLSSLCRWLEANHIPTSRNAVREYKGKKPLKAAHWDTTSLAGLLQKPTVIGEFTTNGQTYRDETGMAIKRADPLIPREKWEQVKKILADNAARIGPKVNVAPLLRVAYCDECGTGLNFSPATNKRNGKQYRYYACPKAKKHQGCDAKRIPADDLEGIVTDHMIHEVGFFEIRETEELPGVDYSTEMAELAEAIGALSSQIALARVHGHDTGKLEEQRSIHEDNLARLAAEQEEHGRAPRTRDVWTGESWAQRWTRLDWNGRNELLRRHGIKVWAVKVGTEIQHHGLPSRNEYHGPAVLPLPPDVR